jgi:hypothetical protein
LETLCGTTFPFLILRYGRNVFTYIVSTNVAGSGTTDVVTWGMSVVKYFQTYSSVGFLKYTVPSTASVPNGEDNGGIGNAGCLAARENDIGFIHHKTLKAE